MNFYCIMVTNMFRPLMWQSSGWFLWDQEENCNYNVSESLHSITIRIKIQKTLGYIASNDPQFAHTIHILHNIHKYGPVETTITLLHSPPPPPKKKEWTPWKITIFNSFTNTTLLLRNKHEKKSPYSYSYSLFFICILWIITMIKDMSQEIIYNISVDIGIS